MTRPATSSTGFRATNSARATRLYLLVGPPAETPAGQLISQELLQLYSLCEAGEEQRALERAIATLEKMFRTERFEEADTLIARADVERLAPRVLLGMLTISYHAKARLKKRPEFLAGAEARLRRALGSDRTALLLASRR